MREKKGRKLKKSSRTERHGLEVDMEKQVRGKLSKLTFNNVTAG